MILNYNATGAKRREFTHAVAAILNQPVTYLGTPSFAFAVGEYTIDRNGNLHCPVTEVNSDGISGYTNNLFRLIDELKKHGFEAENAPKPPEATEPPSDEDGTKESSQEEELAVLAIELPRSGFSDEAIANISKIIQSKATLIRASIGKNLLKKAKHLPVEALEDKLRFPWFVPNTAASDINAYTYLLVHICGMAKRQKYVIAQEREVENQKYAFRCFLLRLGFIGSQYGAARKILLANLSGDGSNKNGLPRTQSEAADVQDADAADHVANDANESDNVDADSDTDTAEEASVADDSHFRKIGPFVFVGNPN